MGLVTIKFNTLENGNIDTREDREMSGHQNSGIRDKLNSEFFGLCFTAATSCNMYCDTNKECNCIMQQ
jgi:hypothetical protein